MRKISILLPTFSIKKNNIFINALFFSYIMVKSN